MNLLIFFSHAFQQLFASKRKLYFLSSIHTLSCILYIFYLNKIDIANQFWTRKTLLLATDNEQFTYCLIKVPETMTSWQKYVTFVLCLSVIFLWCSLTFVLQKDCICSLYAKAFLCIFKIDSSGSFAFAGSGLRNTIKRLSEWSKIGETNMNIYRNSKAICIVHILLL